MARPEKVAVVEEVRGELADNPATLLTEYRGLSVSELAELRAALREAGARYVVVKNTLARIAARDAGFEALEEMLSGPTALTICADDPVMPAKALRSFAKDHPELVIKGGILEGRVVDAETAGKLADLETREELLSKLAGMLYGALANAANLFQAPITEMARLVAALEEKGEAPAGEPEGSDEPEESAEPAEAEDAAEPEVEDAAEPEAAEDEEPEAADGDAEVADDDAADATSDAVEAVTGVAAEAVDAAGDAVASAAEAAGDASGADGAAGAVASTVEGAADAASDAVSAVGEAAGNAVGAAVDAIAGDDETEADEDSGEEDQDDQDDQDDEEDAK